MFGELFFLGAGAIIGNVVFSVLVLVIAVAVGSNRGQPDPSGHRLKATYLCVVLFFSLFTTLLGATSAMGSLMDLTRSEEEAAAATDFPEMDSPPFDDGGFDARLVPGAFEVDADSNEEAARGLMQGLFVAAAAGALLVYHRRRMLELAESDDFVGGPAAPVFSTYLYVSSLVGLLAFVVGASMALAGLAQVVAPGTFSFDDADLAREEGARQAFVGAFLAVASMAIVVLHHRERVLVEPDEDEPTVAEHPIA
jgi:hypothetical protein